MLSSRHRRGKAAGDDEILTRPVTRRVGHAQDMPADERPHLSERAIREIEVILDRAARRRLLRRLGLDPVTGRQPHAVDDRSQYDDPRERPT